MNPDFSIFSATESLSTNDLVVFAADWKTRTFHRHLTCSVISSELCRKTSFVAEGGSSLIEIIEFCGVIARSPTGKARLCGSEGGSRAADSLFMRRVLLRESLTVIPLMKWKYIFSCRRIWKCLGKKKFKKHWYHSCPPSPPPHPRVNPPERFIWCHANGQQWPFSFCIDPGAVCWASTLLELQPLLTFHWANWGAWRLYAVDLDLKQKIIKTKNNKELLLQIIMCLICRPSGESAKRSERGSD